MSKPSPTFSTFKAKADNLTPKAFDTNLIKFHSQTQTENLEEAEEIPSPEEIVADLVNNFEAFANDLDIPVHNMVNLLTAAMQSYISENYNEEHIAPKYKALSIAYLKSSVEYAKSLSLEIADLRSQKSIKTLEKELATQLKLYNIEYSEVSGLQERPVGLCN